ncbi:MAG: PAS domain S-box protein, partial [Elusimicrobia bacterium]|nr:PAS domain S-box protein [Elusimicrobiota bacterium]
KDGAEFPVEISLGPLKTADGVFVVSAIRDLSERVRLQKALGRAEESLGLMIDSVRDHAIFRLDEKGRVATWNRGAQRLKGWAAEEIIGRHFRCFYPPEDAAARKPERELERAARQGSCEDEGWRLRKDGSRFWASVSLSAIRDASGKLVGFAKITRDRTAAKNAEDALLAAKAAAESAGQELEAFSYSVAHDLRAPLRAIGGFSQVLLEGQAGRLDEEGRQLFGRIRVNVSRMERLIDDLLILSRAVRTPLEVVSTDLSALASEIARTLRPTQPERKVEFVIQPGLRARGDRGLLRQVLENLLSNAWKYTGKHPSARIEFSAALREGRQTYCVRDDGAGFDMAYVHKLFTPFNRLHSVRDFPGSGVGLATVRRIIERHGGRVWAEGRPEAGAAFYFTLGEERNEEHHPSGRG